MTPEEKAMKIDDARYEMDLLHSKMAVTVKKISHCQNILDQLNHKLWKDRMNFERIDRELAMIDGRYQVITRCPKVKEEKVKVSKFTREQILELAKQLGLDLNI
jgi:hypothetical protein